MMENGRPGNPGLRNLPASRPGGGRTGQTAKVPAERRGRSFRLPPRPVRIGLLNLMPNKQETEVQFARLFQDPPFAVDLAWLRPGSHTSRNTSPAHLLGRYVTWSDVRDWRFDAFLVTGAPVEMLAYEDVGYWSELQDIFDWIEDTVPRSLFICWAAQAVLYHRYGIPKHPLQRKAFGVYRQQVLDRSRHPALAGIGRDFVAPVSRQTEVRRADIVGVGALSVLAAGKQTGLCLVEDGERGALMMFNHLEYDTGSLAAEYARDRAAGLDIAVPANYFPDDNPEKPPVNTWAPAARTFFNNWIATAAAHAGIKAFPAQSPAG